mgnify:CR=1 FL=1
MAALADPASRQGPEYQDAGPAKDDGKEVAPFETRWATMIVSELFLLEEGALFYYSNTIGGRAMVVLSPWPFAILIYTLIGLLFFWLTVRKIRKIANK